MDYKNTLKKKCNKYGSWTMKCFLQVKKRERPLQFLQKYNLMIGNTPFKSQVRKYIFVKTSSNNRGTY